MRRAFLLSVRQHMVWFFQAFSSHGRQMVPLHPKRLLWLLLLFPLFFLYQVTHWIGFFLDELLFRSYRKIKVKNPIFVTGIPRSGTTFIHRTLANDTGQFTSFPAWEVILAPSITEKWIFHGLSLLDRRIGKPLHRLLNCILNRLTRNLDDIHELQLKSPEEDYLCLLPAGGCFILCLAFPASPHTWLLSRFQDMDERERGIFMDFYRKGLQKHLFFRGRDRRIVSKNAAFASWVPDLRIYFPDARFIFCIRKPLDGLSSQLSSITGGIAFFGCESAADVFSLEFQTVFAHAYRVLRDEMQSFLPDHLVIIDQGSLKDGAEELLTAAVKRLGIDITEAMEGSLVEAGKQCRNHTSNHEHELLEPIKGPVEFTSCVDPLYREMYDRSVRP